MLKLNVLIVSGSPIVRLGLNQVLKEINSQARIMLAADLDSAWNVLEYRQCSIIFADEDIINNWLSNKGSIPFCV